MKIVMHRYGSICEPDLIEAFRSLEFTVIEEDTEIHQKAIAPDKRIALIAEAILTHRPAFVFSINYFPYISEVCQRLDTLYVCFSVDCPVLEFFSASIRNRCNRIFLFDYNQYLQFKDENPTCIFYLPLGTNTDRWDAVFENSRDIPVMYDVSFVGSLYTEKSTYPSLSLSEFDRGFCDGLIRAQAKFPGLSLIEDTLSPEMISRIKNTSASFPVLPDAFRETDAYVVSNYILGMEIASYQRIRTLNTLAKHFQVDLFTRSDVSSLIGVCCHGGVTTHTEMPLIFKQSKINLNITIPSIQTGLSQRIWDVLGCGGFLLTNYQMELPEYFEIGTDLDAYETHEELKEKVAYYLKHEDVRRSIAESGYQKVKEKHSVIHRVLEMLNIIFSCP